MGYLGQKYDKGIVIQRSEEGSAFQEDVEVTVEGEQELTPKVSGGFKKVTVNGAGGSEVIPNPEMEGDEEHLSSLEIDGTKYNLDGKIYDKDDIVNIATIDYDTAANRAHIEIAAEATDSEAIAAAGAIENRIGGTFTSAEAYLSVTISDEEMSAVKAGFEIDAETGDSRTYVEINADEVNINGQPYSPGTEVIANPTLAGTEANLTGLQVGNTKYKVPQGGGASVDSTPLFSGQLDFSTDNVILPTVTSYNYPEVNMEDVNNWINWLGYPLERMVIKVDVYKPTDTWIPVSVPIDTLGANTISIMIPLGEAVQIHRFGTGGSEGQDEWAHCMRLQHRFNAGFYNLGTPWELGDCDYSGDLYEFNFELSYPSSFSEIEHTCSIFGAGTPLGKTVTYPNMDNNWYSYTVVLGQDANSNECSCYHQGNIQEHPAPENGEE